MKSEAEKVFRRILFVLSFVIFTLVEKDIFKALERPQDYLSMAVFLLLCILLKQFEIEIKDEISLFLVKFSPLYGLALLSLVFEVPFSFLIFTLVFLADFFLKREKENRADYADEVAALFFTLGLAKYIYTFASFYLGDKFLLVKYLLLALVYYAASFALQLLKQAIRLNVPVKRIAPELFSGTFRIHLFYLSVSLAAVFAYKNGTGVFSFLFLIFLYIGNSQFVRTNRAKGEYTALVKMVAEACSDGRSNFDHLQRTHEYAIKIGRDYGMNTEELELLGYAAWLHDIGKIGVDEYSLDYILETAASKPGKTLHADIGGEMAAGVPFLAPAAEIIATHHTPFSMHKSEGYEEGALPLATRVLAVANRYTRLFYENTEEYRLTPQEVWRKIKKEQGIVYDPKIVRILLKVIEREEKEKKNPLY